MTNKALEINNLDGRIGDFSLRGIDFSIEKGTIMGFIGKNGSGKTTLIKTIINMISPSSLSASLYFAAICVMVFINIFIFMGTILNANNSNFCSYCHSYNKHCIGFHGI